MMRSQVEQPRKRQSDQEPIKYGDVFIVSDELADKPIAPVDMMQNSESITLGQAQNESSGFVGLVDDSDMAGAKAEAEGVSVAEETHQDVPVAWVVNHEYGEPSRATAEAPLSEMSAITIGEALETTAKTIGYKAVDQNDAAAIEAAEARCIGSDNNVVIAGGLTVLAQSAVSLNRVVSEKNKIKLKDILTDATLKLAIDKAATREDAEEVVEAELLNKPIPVTTPGGVAAAVKSAARLNETSTI
ncbi:hypothetical protein F8388_001747 [Cannabis sativa]|uniref:SMP domain-containing protein n=1 Tax=Cannabis sativa TaxID=3483 RepID=A0A7J6F535_CANSA|nr:hypothetical protein F8388_001747 [Cannabis sativa]